MKISEIEVRCCTYESSVVASDEMRNTSTQEGLEFLVITLATDEGLKASSFGFAARSARGSGELAAASMRPFLTGRDPLMREKHWQDFRTEDRWWNHLPIYSYGPFDACMAIIGALDAGQPLYKYLGGARSEIPVYGSSLVLPSPEAYAEEAIATRDRGYKAYKIHPPGTSYDEDLEIHRTVREAVGPDFTLMSDPVAPFNLEQAIRFGRELEKLNYKWLEEPLYDENFSALRELTRVLDIPIVGTEVIAKHPYSVAECIATRVVDRVRADVSWTGGVTGVMKTAAVAEAFMVNCEIHTAIMWPLELINLHCCLAISNSDYFELLLPDEKFGFGLSAPLPIKHGIAHAPEGAGLGIDLDWDLIDNCTTKVL